jgi:hypothetical protein
MTNRRKTDPNERHLQVVGGTEHTPHTAVPAPERHEDAAYETYTAEDAAELEALLDPMLGMFAEGIAQARWPLEAELHASEVLGILEDGIAGAASEITPRPEDAGFEPFDMLLAQLVAHAERRRTPESLAVLRALAPFVDGEFRRAVDDAANRVAASGATDPAWANTIGRPTVERCWRFGDIFGSQVSYHVVFAYGRRRHLLAILIDNVLGGGIKDSWVSDKPDRLWTEVRRESERQSDTFLEEIPWNVARTALLEAAEREPCPVDPDQVEDVARHAPLVRARLSVDDDAATAGGVTEPAVRRRRRPREVLQLKVSLKGSRPPIWRRLEVPATITLDELHQVIQVAFEWTDSHLHAFETPQGEYGVPDPEWGLDLRSERGVRLSKVATVGEKLTYVYDFGDDWQHVVLVEKAAPSQEDVSYPRCTAGRRAAPPEDCGGIWGYQDMLDAVPDAAYFSAADVTADLADLAR